MISKRVEAQLTRILRAPEYRVFFQRRAPTDKDVLLQMAAQGTTAATHARRWGLTYHQARAQLLRLVRRGMLRRYRRPSRGDYIYRITDHGLQARFWPW